MILRIYWDGQEHPSVESPLGDFFCTGWKSNLEKDPGEKHDLSCEKPELAQEMKATLWQWRQDVEAKIPEPNPDWR